MSPTSRLGRALRFAVGALALVAVAAPSAAAAAEDDSKVVTVRRIDALAHPRVSTTGMLYGAEVDLGSVSVQENGKPVEGASVERLAAIGTRVVTVLAIDTSAGMDDAGALSAAKAAAHALVADRLGHERIGLVTFGGDERVVLEPTADQAALDLAIDGLVVREERSLWDGVATAASLVDGERGEQVNVIVITNGADTRSSGDQARAVSTALANDAAVFTVGLAGSDLDETGLEVLAARTGGAHRTTDSSRSFTDLVGDAQQAVQGQFVVSWSSSPDATTLDLVVEANGASTTAAVNAGSLADGVGTRPRIIPPDGGGLFASPLVKWAGALLAFLAVGLGAFAVASLLAKEESSLSHMLRPYSDDPDDHESDSDGALAQTPLMQRAVEMTEQFAERRGFLIQVERKLEEADLALRASEAIFFYAVSVLLTTVASLLLTGKAIVALMVLVLTAIVPPGALNFMVRKRKKAFMAQLPDTLQLLSGSLRAGYSLMQGVEAVSQEVSEPMGKELRRIMTEARLGRPLEQAMDDAAERMQSPDFSWAVMAIRIQREVGGNLSELLMTVSDTMIQRERLRRDVKALTAEGTISAIVLGLLPLGLGAVMYVLNPTYISVLIDETIGNFLLGGAICLAGAGFYWMKKTIEIEV